MLTPWEFDRSCEQRTLALKAAQPPTPGHSAAAAANEYAGDTAADADAQRTRSRVQHEVDPYLGDDDDCEMDAAVAADLDKAYRQASDAPSGYPHMTQVNPEMFRRGPVRTGQAAYGPEHDVPSWTVPVPSATLTPGMISRPLITDGQSRPCAPGGA